MRCVYYHICYCNNYDNNTNANTNSNSNNNNNNSNTTKRTNKNNNDYRIMRMMSWEQANGMDHIFIRELHAIFHPKAID